MSDDFTKKELDLAKKIAEDHYVELTTKTSQEAALKLDDKGLVRIFEKEDDTLWVKGRTRDAYGVLCGLNN